jgi:hypothetical protein
MHVQVPSVLPRLTSGEGKAMPKKLPLRDSHKLCRIKQSRKKKTMMMFLLIIQQSVALEALDSVVEEQFDLAPPW